MYHNFWVLVPAINNPLPPPYSLLQDLPPPVLLRSFIIVNFAVTKYRFTTNLYITVRNMAELILGDLLSRT